MHALAAAHDAAVQMIDTSIVRACISTPPALLETKDNPWVGHEAGGLTSKNSCSRRHQRPACPSGPYSGRSSRQPARLETFVAPAIGINAAC